ncbi:MAG: DNA polymerase III subunit epsilon [Arcanobacterium sp.]|nr:DNA polymerase III subunit epsilon [Arcanobacterium sp.]
MEQKLQARWPEQPIVGFDTETTGVDPVADRLVTASVVVVSTAGVEKFYWLADPGVDIPLSAQNVHGISTEQARREGEPVRKVLDEVAQLLHVHMEQGHPIVAFNASFDFTLIENELARHDLPTLAERLGRPIGPVIDPFMLDKTVDKFRRGKRNLETVARFYNVWNADNFHNAEADVIVTLRVLGALLRRHPDVASESLADLMDQQRETYTDMANYFARKALENGRGPDVHVGWPVAS